MYFRILLDKQLHHLWHLRFKLSDLQCHEHELYLLLGGDLHQLVERKLLGLRSRVLRLGPELFELRPELLHLHKQLHELWELRTWYPSSSNERHWTQRNSRFNMRDMQPRVLDLLEVSKELH